MTSDEATGKKTIINKNNTKKEVSSPDRQCFSKKLLMKNKTNLIIFKCNTQVHKNKRFKHTFSGNRDILDILKMFSKIYGNKSV